MICAWPSLIAATAELDVPRSIPTTALALMERQARLLLACPFVLETELVFRNLFEVIDEEIDTFWINIWPAYQTAGNH